MAEETQSGESTQTAGSTPAGSTQTAEASQAPAFKAPATQEELDGIIEARLRREREKYKGFDELKTKAAEYDKAQEASKSELQKLQERAEAAEKKAQAYEQQQQIASWTAEVAKASGVPAEALRGQTKEEIEAHAETLKPHFVKGAAPHVPGQGTQPASAEAPNDWLREGFSKR
jgi:hypothetical protein